MLKLVLCSLWMAAAALAADETALSFAHVRATLHEPEPRNARTFWTLAIGFTQPVEEADLATGQAGFKIFDEATGDDVALVHIESGPADGSKTPTAVHDSIATYAFTIILAPNQLDSTHSYMVVAIGFHSAGKLLPAVAAKLTFTGNKTAKAKAPAPTQSPAGKPGVELNKTSSDIYLSGELDVVSQAPAGSQIVNGVADIKVSYPYIVSFPLFTPAAHDQIFSPLFTLNASSLKNHDPNSMSLGLGWTSELGFANAQFQQNFLLESTKNFSVADGVYSPSLRIPLNNSWIPRKLPILFTPFIGGEFGGNFESPLPQAQGSPVARGVFGSDLTIFVHLPKKSAIKGIGFDAEWLRRILAEKELAVNSTNPADLLLIQVGRSPRDHATANLKLTVTDSLSFTLGYEWGQLPPAYQMVHNLVKVGLLYQAQVKPHP
jgi:hypothetical protein